MIGRGLDAINHHVKRKRSALPPTCIETECIIERAEDDGKRVWDAGQTPGVDEQTGSDAGCTVSDSDDAWSGLC